MATAEVEIRRLASSTLAARFLQPPPPPLDQRLQPREVAWMGRIVNREPGKPVVIARIGEQHAVDPARLVRQEAFQPHHRAGWFHAIISPVAALIDESAHAGRHYSMK